MRTLRRFLVSRANAAAMAVLALALQAGSSGYVQACPMNMKTTAMSATHACCRAAAAKACHGGMKKKACCFLGVMSPCADGAVSEARLSPPTTPVAVIAVTPVVNAAWAALAVPISTAAPPIPTASPPHTAVLLI